MNIDLDRLNELVEIVTSANISELTVRDGEECITIKKPLGPASVPVVEASAATVSVAPAAMVESGAESVPADEAAADPEAGRYVTIVANMVGTFHLSDKPEGEPLVRVGQQVETGQVMCTIESMKLVHEIHSSASGTVVQILVEDGQPVEYGNDLMLVETEGAPGR